MIIVLLFLILAAIIFPRLINGLAISIITLFIAYLVFALFLNANPQTASKSSQDQNILIEIIRSGRDKCNKVNDFIEKDECYIRIMNNYNKPYYATTEEIKSFDDFNQKLRAKELEKYKNDPNFEPYIPDNELMSKSIILQKYYDNVQISNLAIACNLPGWAPTKLFSEQYFNKQKDLFHYSRDDVLSTEHNMRIWKDENPDWELYLEPHDSSDAICGKIARSDKLRALEEEFGILH